MRHGILSNETVISRGAGAENPVVFEDLRRGLIESLGPVGELEELLADELVLITWRRRRVVRYETAAIREHTDLVVGRRGGPVQGRSPSISDVAHINAEDELGEYIALIQAVRDGPDLEDSIVVRSWPQLFEFVDGQFESPIESALGLDEEWSLRSDFSPAEVATLIRAVINDRAIDLGRFWKLYEIDLEAQILKLASGLGNTAEQPDYDVQLASLPTNQAMERVQRYEAHLSRLFYRALHELERLQAIRIALELS